MDLLIVVDEPKPYLERLEDFRNLLLSFPESAWDILVWTEEELLRGRNNPFMRHVLREGKVIYEREEKRSRG